MTKNAPAKNKDQSSKEAATQANTGEARVELVRLYVKDLSLQIPEGAKAFQLEWKPELNFEINTQAKGLTEVNHYEVSISLKCTNTCSGKVAFVVEAVQAGLFKIENLDEVALKQAFGVVCPNILYPFIRESIGDMVLRAVFPQLNLAAVNFETMNQGAGSQTVQ